MNGKKGESWVTWYRVLAEPNCYLDRLNWFNLKSMCLAAPGQWGKLTQPRLHLFYHPCKVTMLCATLTSYDWIACACRCAPELFYTSMQCGHQRPFQKRLLSSRQNWVGWNSKLSLHDEKWRWSGLVCRIVNCGCSGKSIDIVFLGRHDITKCPDIRDRPKPIFSLSAETEYSALSKYRIFCRNQIFCRIPNIRLNTKYSGEMPNIWHLDFFFIFGPY